MKKKKRSAPHLLMCIVYYCMDMMYVIVPASISLASQSVLPFFYLCCMQGLGLWGLSWETVDLFLQGSVIRIWWDNEHSFTL